MNLKGNQITVSWKSLSVFYSVQRYFGNSIPSMILLTYLLFQEGLSGRGVGAEPATYFP